MKQILPILCLLLAVSACGPATTPAPTLTATPPPPTETPSPLPPTATPEPSLTPTATLEPLPQLQVITSDNAAKVSLLRTLEIPEFRAAAVSQCSVEFSPDGSLLSGMCDNSTTPVWEMRSGSLLHTLLPTASHEVAVSFSPGGDVLAIGGFTDEIRFFNPSTGESLGTFATLPSQVWELDFNLSGDQLVSASFLTGLYVWDVTNGQQLWSYGDQDGLRVLSVDYSPGGETLAVGLAIGGVMVIDVASGETVNLPLAAPVGDVAFSPDGQWLAAGSDDNKIRLWGTADYSLGPTLQGHTHYVNGVAFSPDGSLLVSGSHDRRVGLWDLRDGQLIKFLEGHEYMVLRVTVNPAGTLIASISWDGTVRLWGVPEG